MKPCNEVSNTLTVVYVTLLLISFIGVESSRTDSTSQAVCCNDDSTSSVSLFHKTTEECTSVIVTGSVAKDGRAILMKNRDTGVAENKPVYYPSDENGSYAYIMVNHFWMGMNERGLAVMNTAMSVLAFGGAGMDNGGLNEWIIRNCETVEEVCFELNNTEGKIGPYKRHGGTCIGVIDRFGKGAFIEISGAEAYARFVVDAYDSRANIPRHYPGYSGVPGGRDAYALEILDEIHSEKGFISWDDVAQNVSRYVHHKEQGDSCFSINGEICRDLTQAAMVAVSGDARYDGKLNCLWGEYGNPPMVGLFVPSIVQSGEPPHVLHDFWNEVWEKRSYAHGSCAGYYDPRIVREIQSYTFFAEDYTFEMYDMLVKSIPDGLSDAELDLCLRDYTNKAVQVAANIYVDEATVLEHHVFEDGNEFLVATASNSTISDFGFNSTNMEISFNATGPPGTAGFCYAKIPLELLNGIFAAFIDEDECVIGEPSQVGNNSFLHLMYEHLVGTIRIEIRGTTVINEFPCAHGGLVLLTVATLVLIVAALSFFYSRRVVRIARRLIREAKGKIRK